MGFDSLFMGNDYRAIAEREMVTVKRSFDIWTKFVFFSTPNECRYERGFLPRRKGVNEIEGLGGCF